MRLQNEQHNTGQAKACPVCSIFFFVLDAEHVIRLYQEVAKIEGVIML